MQSSAPTAATDDLLSFVSSLSGGDATRVEERLGSGFVRLRVAEAERRQAKHDIRCVEDAVVELLRNSRDAGASRIFVATSREGFIRTLCVIDDGSGIPPEMQDRVFDARVTSKLDSMNMDRWGVHGRGMALYSIRENALEARVTKSAVGAGCALIVRFDVRTIPERADQSTWPSVAKTDTGTEVRGPRNIVRMCAEFALDTRDACKVYVGSPSEIAATMRARISLSPQEVATWISGARQDVAVVARAGLAGDARDLSATLSELGLDMSERTAHRIIRNQIVVLRNVALVLLRPNAPTTTKEKRDTSRRRVALSDADRDEFLAALQQDFEILAQRYYLVSLDRPHLRMGDGKLTVTFSFDDDG